MLENMLEIGGHVLFWSGLLLVALGVVGIFRFPDIYTRIKAMSVINGLGAFLIHLGGALLVPVEHGFRGALVAVMFLLSGPAVAQVIAAAAHRLEIRGGLERDDLASHEQNP